MLETDYITLLGHNWEDLMEAAIENLLQDNIVGVLPKEHIQDTPKRVVKAYKEYMEGVPQKPEDILKTFPLGDHASMILVTDIPVVSLCMHHMMPFTGVAHFGYIPHRQLVGLSKIARLIDALSRRPQLQERLSDQIVHEFAYYVQPKGCGVVIEAMHTCMCIRGAKAVGAMTKTQSLSGSFKLIAGVKSEFLAAIK